MATIGNLRVDLGLNSAQFQNGLNKSQTGMQKFAKAAAIGFAAVAAAGAAAFASIASTAERADKALKTSLRLGIPIEELGRLGHAAEMSGVSINTFEMAMQRFTRRSAEAANGTGAAKDALEALGISLRDSNGALRPTSDMFYEVADALSEIRDPAERVRLAFQLFDSEGVKLINMMEGGSAGLREMGDEAERLGLVFDENTGRMAERFNDNLSRMAKSTTGLVNAFGTMLLPAAVAVTDAIVAMTVPAGEMIGILGEVARWAGVATAAIAGFYAPVVLAGIGTLTTAIGAGLVGAIRAVTAAMMANPLGLLIAGISAAVAAVFIFRDEIKQIIGVDVVAVVKDTGNRIIGIFEGAYNAVVTLWQNLPQVFSGIGKMAWNSLIDELEKPALTIETPWGSWESGGLNVSGMRSEVTQGEMEAMSATVASFGDTLNRNRDYIGDWTSSLGEAWTNADGVKASIDELGNSLDGGGAGGGGGGGGLAGATKTASDALEKMGDIGEQITGKLADTFTDMFVSVLEGGRNIGDMIGSLLKDLGKMFLNQGFRALLGMMGGGGGIGGFFSGLFGGFRAAGGPVSGGKSYVVGERGPELFTPSGAGNITPNHKLGARQPTQINLVVQEGAMFEATVQRIASEGDVRVVKSLERGLPGMLAEAQMRTG